MKPIIDVCCGSKMFWFDKHNPNVEFCDKRVVPYHEYYPNNWLEVNPDTVCDFTDLPFESESFHLVVFDPPHVRNASEKSITGLKYGQLGDDWQYTLSKGFDECWRILKPHGVLIFKWAERKYTLGQILPLFSHQPLFGNKTRKGGKTHWLCFMKLGGQDETKGI